MRIELHMSRWMFPFAFSLLYTSCFSSCTSSSCNGVFVFELLSVGLLYPINNTVFLLNCINYLHSQVKILFLMIDRLDMAVRYLYEIIEVCMITISRIFAYLLHVRHIIIWFKYLIRNLMIHAIIIMLATTVKVQVFVIMKWWCTQLGIIINCVIVTQCRTSTLFIRSCRLWIPKILCRSNY